MQAGHVSEQTNLEFEMSLNEVFERWKTLPPSNDVSTVAALLALGSQHELFSAFNAAPGRKVARCVLLRSMMEVVADIGHIMRSSSKQEKRARAYVNSANELRESLLKAVLEMSSGVSTSTLEKLTDWTDSSIRDRLTAITPSMAQLYDVLSYCTHSHPGKVWLFGDNADEGPISEPFLRRIAFGQIVSVTSRSGDLGVLNDKEKTYVESKMLWLEESLESE